MTLTQTANFLGAAMIAVFMGAMVAFILVILHKIRLVQYLQARVKSKIIYNLLSCQFCLSWWISCLLSLGLMSMPAFPFLLVPVLSTMMAKIFLS